MKPVTDTIKLIEDRLAEIYESGDLELKVDCDGLVTEVYMRAAAKQRFLKGLSLCLHTFDAGDY